MMTSELLVDISSAIVALAALLFSVVSFKNQQDRAERYARASVKPLLSIKSQKYTNLKSIRIVNNGIGPAIIRKAEFRRNPEDIPTNRLVDLFTLDIIWESFVNIPPNRAIPASSEIMLVKQSLAHLIGQGYDEKTAQEILNQWQQQKSGIVLKIEYYDIYGNPFLLSETLN